MASHDPDLIHVDIRKWPDRRHWQFDARRLGDDEHGTWLNAPAGTIAQRGHEPPRPLRVGFVALVPQKDWWVVEFYVDHPRHSVYVNICTPPEWHGDTVRFVDLDLDVIRGLDGDVAVLDEDEFAAHRVDHHYPPALVDGARNAADTAVTMLARRVEPFGRAAEPWLAAANPPGSA